MSRALGQTYLIVLLILAVGIFAYSTIQMGNLPSHAAQYASSTVQASTTSNPDFTISASNVTSDVGISKSSTIIVTPLDGYNGNVSLSDSPPPNFSCSNITPITLSFKTSSLSQSSSVNCSSTIAANYTLTIRAVNATGTLPAHSTNSIFTVQDFSLSAAPTAITVNANTISSSSIGLTPLNGFSFFVTLSTDNPACTVSPTIISGSDASSLSCKLPTAQTTPVTVTGTSGSLSHTIIVTYTVQDFTIQASAPLPVNLGSQATSAISVVSQNGFSGTVDLSANEPSGNVSCNFSTNPVQVETSVPVAMACGSNTAGTFVVTLTAISGTLVHTVKVTISFGDFAIAVLPSSMSVTAGNNASASVIVSSNGYSGSITLTVWSPNLPGLAVGLSPQTFTIVPGSSSSSTLTVRTQAVSPVGSYVLSITCTSCNPLEAHETTVPLSIVGNLTLTTAARSQILIFPGQTRTENVTVTSYGLTGILGITSTAPTPLLSASAITSNGNLSPGSISLVQVRVKALLGISAGNYTVATIAMVGNIQTQLNIVVTVSDFTVTVNPNPISIVAGSTGTTSITVQGLSDFNGTVYLSVSSINDLVPIITPNNVSLTLSSETTNAALQVKVGQSIVPRLYSLTVTARSGIVEHNTVFQLSVVEFAVVIPSSTNMRVGQSNQTIVTLSSRNGFTGSIALIATVPLGSGIVASLNPSSVFVAPNQTITSLLTLSVSRPGIFLISVNATSGPNVSYQYMFVYVGDFTISSASNSLTLTPTGSKTMPVVISSKYNFAGVVNLIADSNPNNLDVSSNPTSVTLSPGSSTSIILSIRGSGTEPGIYNLTITASSGQLSYQKSILVTVALPPTLTVPASESVNPGSLLSFYVNLTDPDPNVRLSASQVPQAASFITSYRTGTDLTTVIGLFSWKVPASQPAGDYVVTFTVQDRNGGMVTRQVTIRVNGGVNRSVVLPSILMIGYGLIAIGGIIATLFGGNAWRRKKAQVYHV